MKAPVTRPTALSGPPGASPDETEEPTVAVTSCGFPFRSRTFRNVMAFELGIPGPEQGIRARRLKLYDLRVHRRVGRFIAGGDDQLADPLAEAVLEALQEIPARIVVLIQHGDPGVRLAVRDVAGIDAIGGYAWRR
jgi:hypothetical protein